MVSPPVVHIVDDDRVYRESLRWMIESVGLTARTYDSAQAFLDAYDDNVPSCLVLDVRMPGMNGLDLQEYLRQQKNQVPVIVVTAYGDVRAAVRAMKGGAFDFLEKPVSDQQLLDFIPQALERDTQRLKRRAELQQAVDRLGRLTKRERQVMELVVIGRTSKQIRDELGVSIKTIDSHRSKIMKKTEAGSLPELVHMYLDAFET